MLLKSNKKKKRFGKVKMLFYVMVIYVSFAYTFYYSLSSNKIISNEEFINLLVSTGNANILGEYKITNVINKTMSFIFSIDFKEPVSLFNGSILGYGEDDSEIIYLEYNDDYSNMDELEEISDYISDPNPVDVMKPIIYLYNSHQLENYSSEDLDIYGITPNVLMASYILREGLNKKGLSTIVEDANMSEVLASNGWNYSYSYRASRGLMEGKILEYPTLEYFIDIHRDSVGREYSTVNIGGKSYARVMFVVGLDHDNWEENYEVASDINGLINEFYPGMSRNIMKKKGASVNGIYNQDISSKCILLEIGGVDNTIEEVYNTMDALVYILDKYIRGDLNEME